MYEARIKHLEQIHESLDKKIDGMEKTGVFGDNNLHDLKKQRLSIRDQLVDLKRKQHEHDQEAGINNFAWKFSDHIIILYYQGYSCGKFLSNIMSFNDHFVPQIGLTEKVERYCQDIKIINSKVLFDQEIENQLREYKIADIFQTIPPDQNLCLNWDEYELGCQMFWNFNVGNIDQPGIIDDVHKNCVRLLYNKKYCFIGAHDQTSLQKLEKYFPNAQIIELINDVEVWKASVKLKTNKKMNYCFKPIHPDSIKFDIGSLFDKQKFFKNIENLLFRFNIDDYTLDQRVFDFYEKYVNLYKGYI